MTKEKTLSEQLCELCGIKPKYKCRNVPCLNFIGNTGFCNISEKRCNPSECKNEYEPDTTHKFWKKGEAYYPDFKNPENFVKLLELKSGDCRPRIGVLIRNAYFLGTDFTRVECLKILIKILCYPNNQGSQVLDELKQSIRDYDDWVWG